jgi:hypothetical protein
MRMESIMDARKSRTAGMLLLACGLAILVLAIILFSSFSIYLSRSMEKLLPGVLDGSAVLYEFALSGLFAGLGMTITGTILLVADNAKVRAMVERIFHIDYSKHAEMKYSHAHRSLIVTIWALPFMSVFLALALQVAIGGVIYSRLIGMMGFGFLILIAGVLFILFRGLLQSRPVCVVFFIINVALFTLLTWLTWIVAYTGYRLLWIFIMWETGFGVHVMIKDRSSALSPNWKHRGMTWFEEIGRAHV